MTHSVPLTRHGLELLTNEELVDRLHTLDNLPSTSEVRDELRDCKSVLRSRGWVVM